MDVFYLLAPASNVFFMPCFLAIVLVGTLLIITKFAMRRIKKFARALVAAKKVFCF